MCCWWLTWTRWVEWSASMLSLVMTLWLYNEDKKRKTWKFVKHLEIDVKDSTELRWPLMERFLSHRMMLKVFHYLTQEFWPWFGVVSERICFNLCHSLCCRYPSWCPRTAGRDWLRLSWTATTQTSRRCTVSQAPRAPMWPAWLQVGPQQPPRSLSGKVPTLLVTMAVLK